MPTYTYRFEDGAEIEIQQAIVDEPLTLAYHPTRNVPMAVRRIYHAPLISLKGKGFYRTGG